MFPRPVRLLAVLCLLLALQLATAQSFQVVKRAAGDAPPPTSVQSDPKPTNKGEDGDKGDKTDNGNKDGIKTAETSVTKSKASQSVTASITQAPTKTTSHSTPTFIATNGALDNSSFVNVTIPEGQLPLKPEITPGWGVAGTIMLITGLVYTLIGIKNRMIHTFFSTAYISGLGIAVLILYVMNVPVSNAVQGGYVVAVVVSGCAIGAASMFFKEITEGLGCALGGFCLSMWLLCLVPGGLLRPTASKAIFIACFTIVGFAFYFSRYTRDWALIVLISFGGATITVLGIDCFSRAGLKEFWAYLWDLNDNLFPLGADTYPVNKGIRVETAAIIIIFLFGIISQIKLWRIVREKREKRAVERAEGQRNLDEEEASVGRRIENATARDRREWERIYGDGGDGSAMSSRDYDIEDTGSEKRLQGSHAGSTKHRCSAEVIEMADMSESSQSRTGPDALMAAGGAEDGKVTVRVAADDVPGSPFTDAEVIDEKAGSILTEGGEVPMSAAELRRASKRASGVTAKNKRVSQAQTVTETPDVVPLPFTVPSKTDARSISERSSVATFADEEDETDSNTAARQPHDKRNSLVKRHSQSSVSLLKSMSQKSSPTTAVDLTQELGESSEDPVIPQSHRNDDDNGSLAATLDDESVSGDDRISVLSTYSRKDIEVTAQLAKQEKANAEPGHDELIVKKQRQASEDAAATTSPTPPDADESTGRTEAHTADSPANLSGADPADDHFPEPSEKPKSIVSIDSAPASLTKERLPRSLSRVAMSYRTNEWAKHLSNADAPEPDDLQIVEAPQPTKATKERTAPVNVEDLQKTAEDGAPPPATIKRSESQASQVSTTHTASRGLSRQAMPSSLNISTSPPLDKEGLSRSPSSPMMNGAPSRAPSAGLRRTASGFQPIAEEHDAPAVTPTSIPEQDDQPDSRRESVSPSIAHSEGLQRSPVPGVVSYSSPQTLLGQREMFLRSKSQGNLIAQTPEPPASIHGSPSESGSLYNYAMYSAALNADVDDIPLSQRKQIMRNGSLMSLAGSSPSLPRVSSGIEASENTPFNSHQPKRVSTLPAPAVRESQLANFRQSVAQDLRSGTPMMTPSGRNTPFASTNTLLGGREAEVQRNIEMQRNLLMSQKEAEAQRREMQRREKEWADRAFDDRMRSGDLLEAHREVMRKMQSGTKNR